jgi:hypothetical protein
MDLEFSGLGILVNGDDPSFLLVGRRTRFPAARPWTRSWTSDLITNGPVNTGLEKTGNMEGVRT